MPHINKPILSIILSFVILCIASSCGDSKRKAYEEAVIEWTGKEILFPNSMRLVGGGMIAKPEADFTIVSYYDSVGCTGCRMKLRFWNEFMQRVDSVRGDNTVNLIMIAATTDVRGLYRIVGQEKNNFCIFIDDNNMFSKLNGLPNEEILQTFLLNRNMKVIAVGNPVSISGIANVYLSYISEKKESFQNPDRNILTYCHDFGTVTSGTNVEYTFHLTNNSNDTMTADGIMTSCECTKATVSRKTVAPGEKYDVTVIFRDTIPGDFYRTVVLSFKDNQEILFEVSGTINK